MLAFRLLLVVLWTLLAVTVRRLLRGPRHPSWGWRLEVVAEVARWGALRGTRGGVHRLRAALTGTRLNPRLAARVKLTPLCLGAVTAESHTPAGWTDASPTILYLHGGGYAFCSPASHRDVAARIAIASGARCIVIDYRLAPEHPYPAALEDCLAAYHALLASGLPPSRLLFAGDSAGGGLSLATMLRLRDAGEPLPVAAVLTSPWVDLTCQGSTIDSHAAYDYVQRETLELFARTYLGGTDPRSPYVSPVHADLSGLPPLLIHAGGAEALRWEIERLAERARAAGVEVTLWVAEGMIHAFHGFAPVLPEARRAIRAIGEFVRQCGAR